jgi:putative holliday junction resolvase
MRTIGIDFGTRNVGVAISDERGKIAFPHGVMANDSALEDTLVSLIRQKKVERIVMGESKNFAGNPNPILQKAKRFAELLRDRTGLELEYESEGLSTVQALKSKMKIEKPVANPRRTSSPLNTPHMDDAAATIILQHYLERKRNEGGDDDHKKKLGAKL